jgi:ribosome-binding protein aMBF1 (putative translation factor)
LRQKARKQNVGSSSDRAADRRRRIAARRLTKAGQFIDDVRRRHGLALHEIAARCSMSRQNLKRIREGMKSGPRQETIASLLRGLSAIEGRPIHVSELFDF